MGVGTHRHSLGARVFQVRVQEKNEGLRMLGRLAVLAASIALASCAGFEPAGRNAQRAPAPPPMTEPARTVAPEAAPAPQTAEPAAPAPQAQPSPPVAAPDVSVSTPAPQPQSSARAGGNDIVVPGQREQQVQPPAGDPRSTAQRMEDVRAWDRCVMEAQSAFESDPMRPQLNTPEEYCRRNLGMASRLAVPESRLRRQR